MPTIRRIPAYRRQEPEIIQRTTTDGRISYHHPGSTTEVRIVSEDLFDLFFLTLNRFRALVNFFDEDLYDQCGRLLDTLIRECEGQLDEAATIVAHEIGTIECDVVGQEQWPYRDGRLVNAQLTPAKEER